jgi:hypothetical protein
MTTTTAPKQLADQAAEAIRTLNHLTRSGRFDGFEYPGDIYDIVGELQLLAYRLPQLCSQLAQFLIEERDAGRIAHDQGEPVFKPVASAVSSLNAAGAIAENAASQLGKAHAELGHLKAV